ncbi:DegT/DnrJ/EryC1/StrS aminotransferase family protein [Candidatus Propionivibrio aalborgensis]|uniref:DegT/DnrJ/EryC1/StrS aminotransferase family protein n=1 Tax=Candidatus Propionivibrio aalborgensis TaxID=1860101 RepID=A0A1A8XZE3_9RHOO|nr:DegT/DnrJ/EryC1/StrS family aminotransferase [Candidatus Propionivibrio aalborgensis]SBT09433.1 DegT/DnrJ/EryC1/StrS aminotransferase family protein [Candidatus Propionivibrio aalborgensis]
MRNIPFGRPIIGDEERSAVLEVLSGTQFVHGPLAKKFETDFSGFIGGGYAHTVASCTAGLHLAYVYLGIGPGDEVIVPAQTHVATAHSVEYTGARPVFVDVDATTGNIDIDGIEAAISPRTKAISVVHYLGLPVDMDRVNVLARKHDLFVVEDAALALGARYKGVHAGLIGDVGSFSFYPVKHITTAEGGMFTTRHAEVAAKVARLKAFGYDKMVGERVVPGLYDVDLLGYNYRMNEIEAAIGVQQLKRVGGFLTKRAENDAALRKALEDIDEVKCLAAGGGDFEHAHYCLVAVLDDAVADKRYDIINGLRDLGVGTSVYYPGPVPHLKYYRDKYDLGRVQYPNAARISNHSIALSVGPHLDEEDMIYVGRMLKQVLGAIK